MQANWNQSAAWTKNVFSLDILKIMPLMQLIV